MPEIHPYQSVALPGSQPPTAAQNATAGAASGSAPKWVSNACNSEAAIQKATATTGADKKKDIVTSNSWKLWQLYNGQDANEIATALAKATRAKGLGDVIKRWFAPKKAAVPVTKDGEIVLYPVDFRYAGLQGYYGFAYARQAATYTQISRIPEKMMEDPHLADRVAAGLKRVASELRKTGKLPSFIQDFKGTVGT